MKRGSNHGMCGTRIYHIWGGMIRRCTNPNSREYFRYGGRGIKVCTRWRDFRNFYKDMKAGYSDNLTIDRINNNEGYYKANCRWSTWLLQRLNKRKKENCASKYIGVTWYEQTKKWQARLGINKKQYRLGYYSTELSAHKAYIKAKTEFLSRYKGEKQDA